MFPGVFFLASLRSAWKLSFTRFSSISLAFVVEPYLDGCPVKVVQLCKFFNNSVQRIPAVFCKCENFVLLFAVDEAACFLFPVKQKQNEFKATGH